MMSWLCFIQLQDNVGLRCDVDGHRFGDPIPHARWQVDNIVKGRLGAEADELLVLFGLKETNQVATLLHMWLSLSTRS